MKDLENEAGALEVMKSIITRMDNKYVADFYNHNLWVQVSYDKRRGGIYLRIHEQKITEDLCRTLKEDLSGEGDNMQTCYDELLKFLVENTHVQDGKVLPRYVSIVRDSYKVDFSVKGERAFWDLFR
ncbi:MAG: hypothetical protein KKF50_01750 [Nanoarchaeota archaeon]|nr:hypothetical protein [Nanoarchaeota archaeon]